MTQIEEIRNRLIGSGAERRIFLEENLLDLKKVLGSRWRSLKWASLKMLAEGLEGFRRSQY
ncbi:MAG TPA: hypothetical protein VGQ12_10090 [Candidatus Angelobacter sp.]|jgi:hypothetical protein|nr:hypothetical protein [Candidatus Angelobacter sp.]